MFRVFNRKTRHDTAWEDYFWQHTEEAAAPVAVVNPPPPHSLIRMVCSKTVETSNSSPLQATDSPRILPQQERKREILGMGESGKSISIGLTDLTMWSQRDDCLPLLILHTQYLKVTGVTISRTSSLNMQAYCNFHKPYSYKGSVKTKLDFCGFHPCLDGLNGS